ncbi:MAG: hypothetical protein L3K15_05330 [Thermoplasmata archaeon]|nr:hypothetical protein [Thermoplasmata archaeon]
MSASTPPPARNVDPRSGPPPRRSAKPRSSAELAFYGGLLLIGLWAFYAALPILDPAHVVRICSRGNCGQLAANQFALGEALLGAIYLGGATVLLLLSRHWARRSPAEAS